MLFETEYHDLEKKALIGDRNSIIKLVTIGRHYRQKADKLPHDPETERYLSDILGLSILKD